MYPRPSSILARYPPSTAPSNTIPCISVDPTVQVIHSFLSGNEEAFPSRDCFDSKEIILILEGVWSKWKEFCLFPKGIDSTERVPDLEGKSGANPF